MRCRHRKIQTLAATLVLTAVVGCGEPEGDVSALKFAEPAVVAEPAVDAAAVADSADAADIDRGDRDRLRALGYVGVAEPLPPGAKLGVLTFDRAGTQPGINLFTNAAFCSAQLIDLAGTLLHAWSQQKLCKRWSGAFLAGNGDLVVIGKDQRDHNDSLSIERARFLQRLSWDGELLWKRQIRVHHDLDLQPDGRIFALTYRRRVEPEVHDVIPLRDHSLVLMSADGEVLEEAPLWEMLVAAGDLLSLAAVEPRRAENTAEVDLIHANSVERMPYPELLEKGFLYREDHVLLCLRSQDLLIVVDWSERRVVWAWGAGELSGPHDASWLPNGHILVFDNGLGRDWSRVVELDPITREIVWQYRAAKPTDFYTQTQGTNQRLLNGNTLIAESGTGRVFEVTSEGRVVWEFLNFNLTREREPSVIPRMRRLQNLDFAELSRAVEAGDVLPRSD